MSVQIIKHRVTARYVLWVRINVQGVCFDPVEVFGNTAADTVVNMIPHGPICDGFVPAYRRINNDYAEY